MAKNVNKEEKKWNHKRSEENIAPLQSCIHKRKRRSKKKKKKKKEKKKKKKKKERQAKGERNYA